MKTPNVRHLTYRQFERLRHSTKFLNWIDATAKRLTMSPPHVFELLKLNSAAQIDAMPATPPVGT